MDPQIQFMQIQFTIERLISDYVHCIDDDRLEEWPGFFADPCVYKITSAENYERGLQTGATMLFATGRYLDRIALDRIATDEPRPLFVEKIVVCDSRRIDTLLAIPL